MLLRFQPGHEAQSLARTFTFLDQTSLCALQPRHRATRRTQVRVCLGPARHHADEKVPGECEAQADLCFANIAAILAEDGMTLANIVRLNAYVTAREHMQGYMRSRDRQFPELPPSSTLM